MLNIGIFDKTEIFGVLKKIYNAHGINNCLLYDDKITIINDENICRIVQNVSNSLYGNNDIILVNADKKNDYKLLAYNKAKIVTYGLNHKCCVTASSINESEYKTIQFCIQRSIPTISGKLLEPQELPVRIYTENDVSTVLAGVTVALINDFDVEIIKSWVIR